MKLKCSCLEDAKTLSFHFIARVVKWQTRYLEVVELERVCRFKSCSAHQNYKSSNQDYLKNLWIQELVETADQFLLAQELIQPFLKLDGSF